MRMNVYMDEADLITKKMREKLQTLLPSVGKELYVFVYSKKQQETEWHYESGYAGKNGCSDLRIFTEYEKKESIPDSRIGAWGKPTKIKWTIYITAALRGKLDELEAHEKADCVPMKHFFDRILSKMSAGLIDCDMFRRLKEGESSIIDHIYSELPKMTDLMNECVEELMRCSNLPDPFIITQLSSQMYERRPIHGSMLFLSEDRWKALRESDLKEKNNSILSLTEVKREQRKLSVVNMRFLRKLMELSSDGASVVVVKKSSGESVAGEWLVAGLAVNQAVENEESIWIDFKGQLKWAIRKNRVVWFTYADGIFKQQIEECLRDDYKKIIMKARYDESEKLIKIIDFLQKERHGTSVVFLENANSELSCEVERFFEKNRCIKLSENGVELQEYLEKMKGITAIDGALLADFSGRCYAIGVIFDGEMMIEGNVSRGSRFNSVANYVHVAGTKYGKDKIMGVIISEDGGVEVKFPEENRT